MLTFKSPAHAFELKHELWLLPASYAQSFNLDGKAHRPQWDGTVPFEFTDPYTIIELPVKIHLQQWITNGNQYNQKYMKTESEEMARQVVKSGTFTLTCAWFNDGVPFQ